MNEAAIRVGLEPLKATLSEPTADIADLEVRAHHVGGSLALLIGQGRRSIALTRERVLRTLVELWAEVEAALKARGGLR